FAIGAIGLGLLAACGGSKGKGAEVAKGGKNPDGNVIADGDPEDDGDEADWGIVDDKSYTTVVNKVVGMVGDQEIRMQAQRRGLDVVNVMWEDTGRAQGSALGPNISELTLQVRYRERGNDQDMTALMPVI